MTFQKGKDTKSDAAFDFTAQLKGKQSVRTTFKLSEGTIHAVSIVAAHLGIKQKSLFDQLMEDLGQLGGIASSLKRVDVSAHHRVPKTYVVSRRSLASLEQIALAYKIPRDMLVELSVQRLLPLIAKERAQHEKRKQILLELEGYLEKGVDVLRKTRNLLGDDDQVTERVAAAVFACQQACRSVDDIVERGKAIEEFDEE